MNTTPNSSVLGHKRKFHALNNAENNGGNNSAEHVGQQHQSPVPRSPSMSTSNALHPFPNKKIRSSFELMNGASPVSPPPSTPSGHQQQQPHTPTTPSTTNAFALHSQQQQSRVVQEQRKRLAMKVRQQTRKIDGLQKQMEQLQEERGIRENVLSVVYRNWSAMLQDMEIIAKRLPTENEENNNNNSPKDSIDNATSSSLVSDAGKTFLEQLLASYAIDLSSGVQSNIDTIATPESIADNIQKQVESGCQKAMQILRAVVTEVQAEKTRNDTLMKQINEDTGFKKREQTLMLIKEDNKKVRSENEELQRTLDDLQIKYRTLSTSQIKVTDDLARTQRLAAQYKEDFEKLQDEFEKTTKTVQRLQSSIDSLQNEQLQASQASSDSQQQQQQQQPDQSSQSQAVFTDEDTQKLIASFTDEIQHLRSTLQSRDADMERLLYQLSSVEHAKQKLERDMVDEQFVRNTSVYKSLQELYNITNVFYVQEKKTVRAQEQRIKTLDEERDRVKKEMTNMYEHRLQFIASELEVANSEIGALRRENEEMRSTLRHREHEPAGLQSRLEQASAEKGRLEARVEELTKDVELYKTDKEDLVKRVKTLQEAVRKRKREFDALEREHQDSNQKLQVYRNSTRLPAEQKTLCELQGSEAALKVRLTNLESELDRYKTLTDATLREELDSIREECAALSSALDDLGTHCHELEEENEKLSKKISQLEQSSTDLIREKIVQQQKENMLRTEKEQLEKSILAGRNLEKEAVASIEALQAKVGHITQELAAAKGETTELYRIVERQKSEIVMSTQQRDSLQEEHSKQQQSLNLAEQQAQSAMQERDKLEMRLKKVEEERDLTKRRIKKMKNAGASGALSVEMEELRENMDYFKDMVTCSVCSTGRKNRIIGRCFHMFCDKCVQDTLQARNRRCPTCKASFGRNDVHEVYF